LFEVTGRKPASPPHGRARQNYRATCLFLSAATAIATAKISFARSRRSNPQKRRRVFELPQRTPVEFASRHNRGLREDVMIFVETISPSFDRFFGHALRA